MTSTPKLTSACFFVSSRAQEKCVDTPRVTSDFSAKVFFEVSGLESCQSYRFVVTAVTGLGKSSLEAVYVTKTGFEGQSD